MLQELFLVGRDVLEDGDVEQVTALIPGFYGTLNHNLKCTMRGDNPRLAESLDISWTAADTPAASDTTTKGFRMREYKNLRDTKVYDKGFKLTT